MRSLISYSFAIALSLPVQAQKTEHLKISSIPFVLYWENQPLTFSLDKNSLALTAGPRTDMFRDPNVTYNTDNAPKLLFKPDADFVLTAQIEHAFTNKWDGGAMVLKSDSLNWIKFCFEKDYTGVHRVVSVVTRNISDDCNSVEIKSNHVFYKIAKADNVITLYYSNDGKQWFLIRHLQFDAKPGFSLGFLAQSPTGERCEVHFNNIAYEAKKIKDPYEGN